MCTCLLAVHFEITYNGDRIIEINVSTDPNQVVDISEDVVKVIPITPLYFLPVVIIATLQQHTSSAVMMGGKLYPSLQ